MAIILGGLFGMISMLFSIWLGIKFNWSAGRVLFTGLGLGAIITISFHTIFYLSTGTMLGAT